MSVFQGSALEPLLFSVFANGLSLYAAGTKVLQYADDTQVHISGRKRDLPVLVSSKEESLPSLDKGLCANALEVNADKTHLISFGTRQTLCNLPDFEVAFRDASLVPCNEVRNLVDIVYKTVVGRPRGKPRCNGYLIGFSHIQHVVPRGVITLLVTSLVLSQVRYC